MWRELRNVIERAVILARSSVIGPELLRLDRPRRAGSRWNIVQPHHVWKKSRTAIFAVSWHRRLPIEEAAAISAWIQ